MVGRKLAQEEIEQLEKKERKSGSSRLAKQAEYEALMADYSAGDYGELLLDEGETKLTVKKNIKQALERRGLSVKWYRGKNAKFQVIDPNPAYGDGH